MTYPDRSSIVLAGLSSFGNQWVNFVMGSYCINVFVANPQVPSESSIKMTSFRGLGHGVTFSLDDLVSPNTGKATA